MTTIPADILEIARELASLCGDSDQARYDRRDDIAAALMAERLAQKERDAKIAEDEDGHFSYFGEDRNSRVARQVCRDAAAAIRKGTP